LYDLYLFAQPQPPNTDLNEFPIKPDFQFRDFWNKFLGKSILI